MSGLSTVPLSLEDVDALAQDAFVELFGGIAEHGPWVAEVAERSVRSPRVTQWSRRFNAPFWMRRRTARRSSCAATPTSLAAPR